MNNTQKDNSLEQFLSIAPSLNELLQEITPIIEEKVMDEEKKLSGMDLEYEDKSFEGFSNKLEEINRSLLHNTKILEIGDKTIQTLKDFTSVFEKIVENEKQNQQSIKDKVDEATINLIECRNITGNTYTNTYRHHEEKYHTINDMERGLASPLNFNTNSYSDTWEKMILLNIQYLKQWSGLNNCNVIFDSKHDCERNSLLKERVMNKSHLYFICFDGDGNVFGGYLNNEITHSDTFLLDYNAFVFSLYRNGNHDPKHFMVLRKSAMHSFYLFSNNDFLYQFGYSGDISICRVGCQSCCCRCTPYCYDYQNDENALVNNQYPYSFFTQRIFVIQMS